MIKIVIISVLLYLLLGTITLAVMQWHDRQCNHWIDESIKDEIMASLVVLFFPFVWIAGLFWFLFIIFPVKFAHFFMAIPTTIVYVVKALKEMESKDGRDNN